MADVVQYRLERMVDELDEYRLKRPSPLKQDFIAYIDYEVKLDELRRLRRKAVARESDKKMKISISDFTGVAKIVEIYRLATMRYKGDINLWFRYLEFCRQKRNGRMKKVLAQVIRFHPKVAGVWIYAAAWELDGNLKVAAARALMLNGLRECSNSKDLWVEYLRMELTVLHKLKSRRVALGEDEGSLVRDKKAAEDIQWKDENKELFMSLDEKQGNEDSNVEDDEGEKVDVFRETGSGVLQTIYSGSIEAIPSSFDLRKRFSGDFRGNRFGAFRKVRDTILSDMKRDFSKDPEYWDWLARHQFSDSISRETSVGFSNPQMKKAIQVYEESLQIVSSSSTFKTYIKFLMEAITQSNGDADDEISSLSNPVGECISHLINVCERADTTGCLTEDLASEYVALYLKLGRIHEAQNLAVKLCNGKFAGSASCGFQESPLKSDHCQGTPRLLIMLICCLSLLFFQMLWESSKSESLWLTALKFFAPHRTNFDKLVEMSIMSVAKGNGSDHGFSLASTIVKFVLQTKGI